MVEVAPGHEPEVLSDMIELKVCRNLPEVIQPALLLLRPATGEEGKKYAVAYQPSFIAEGGEQVGKPGGNLPVLVQSVERPFYGLYPFFLQ